MAKARRLALFAFAALLAGCGGSSAPEPSGGSVLRLALPLVPATVDPARVADLPSLNVAHELNAGLTRFSDTGVEPDLAESWETSQDGLVWTFRLRKGLRWSNDAPITAEDFRRSWLRALSPALHSAYARAEMQNIRGARRYRVTGSGEVGIEALDDRTLRVTLQHPVPWLDEQVAWPVFFPVPRSGSATSGPFRLASRTKSRLVLERSFNYWNAAAVKPRRVVLTTSTKDVHGILPRGLAVPGFPWIETAEPPASTSRRLQTLAVHLLWFVTRRPGLADATRRFVLAGALEASRQLRSVVPPPMPGYGLLVPPAHSTPVVVGAPHLRLALAYTSEDPRAEQLAETVTLELAGKNATVRLIRFPTLLALVRAVGPPARPDIDLVLLGWSSEFFDAYNILDLFPCASAFNVAQWCDRSYDRLMHRAVRTLDDEARYRIERALVQKLEDAVPAVPLSSPAEHVYLKPGVHGFRWSPIGFYELMGMTRS